MKRVLLSMMSLAFSILMLSMTVPNMAGSVGIVWLTNPTPLPDINGGHGSVLYNNRIYIIGGHVGPYLVVNAVHFAEMLEDGSIASWTPTTPLPEPRSYIRYGVVIWNNYLYVVGGHDGISGERNTVFYTEINSDGSLKGWVTTTSLPWNRRDHFAVVWNGRIYVGGGTDGYGWNDNVAYAEINPDGSLGSWSSTTSLPLAYGAMSAIVYNGRIYLIGGTSTWGGPGLSHSEVYYASVNADGTIGSWTATTPLPDRRELLGVALMDDAIFVTGGMKTPEITFHDEAYKAEINPDGTVGSWQELQNLPEPREFHTSFAYKGRVYVIGGVYYEYKDTIYYSVSATTQATIDIDPNTLNLKSNGQWITVYISPPEGYSAEDIKIATVGLRCNGFILTADWGEIQGSVLMVKFDRTALINYLHETDLGEGAKSFELTLTITGDLLDWTPFEGSDTITVLKK